MKKGFTLIELLVVIVIVGVLASLATISLNSVRSKNRDAKRVGDIRQLQTALEMYVNDNGSYPSAITAGNVLVGPNGQTYMAKVPAAPGHADGTCTTDTYTYSSSSPYSDYSLYYCLGGAVQDAGPDSCAAVPGKICSLKIGMSYQGGVIAYLDATDKHGFVAAAANQSTSKIYSNILDAVGTGTGILTGQANTTAIINQAGHTDSAAKTCDDYSVGSYNDWYLPSKDQLTILFTYRTVIGGFSSNVYYWSSSESSSNTDYAYPTWFLDGNASHIHKSNASYVRCVRSF